MTVIKGIGRNHLLRKKEEKKSNYTKITFDECAFNLKILKERERQQNSRTLDTV